MSARTATATATIRLDDFVCGVLAGLVLAGYSRLDLSDKRLCLGFEAAYRAMLHTGTELRFCVHLDPIYGTNPNVRNAISRASARGHVSFEGPGGRLMRLRLTESEAAQRLELSPGGRLPYEVATSAFVDVL